LVVCAGAASDEDLMSLVQSNQPDAFEELFDRHAGQALGVARSICRDAGRAEDAVQDAFLDVWRSRHKYEAEKGSFKAWAMTLVRHRAIDRVRIEAIRPPLAGSDGEPVDAGTSSTQDDVVSRDEADALRALVRKLPRDQVEVIVLSFYGELSHGEIATQLGLPLGTVKGRMRLGLEKLRIESEARDTVPPAQPVRPSSFQHSGCARAADPKRLKRSVATRGTELPSHAIRTGGS